MTIFGEDRDDSGISLMCVMLLPGTILWTAEAVSIQIKYTTFASILSRINKAIFCLSVIQNSTYIINKRWKCSFDIQLATADKIEEFHI